MTRAQSRFGSAHDTPDAVAARVAEFSWSGVASELDDSGYALLPRLLAREQSAQLIEQYADAALYRSQIVMQRHGYGSGEYQYFARPLPDLVQGLRENLYPRVVEIANAWQERLGRDERFPESQDELAQRCAALGQERPTPLVLKYGPGDFNRLHQDLYGQLVFPLQVAILLSEPGIDFTGGEFVLTEQRARMQSRVEVVPLMRGDGVVFPVSERPVASKSGFSRAKMRHGVSRLRSGARYTLGVIFHDAE
jgi:hypothetical protein